jgi:hypothetical protein
MKIRIKGNSIRLRLSKTEITSFGTLGLLEEKTEFGNSTLTYTLACDSEASELRATYAANKITVHVPEEIKNEWTKTDRVGFENKFKIANQKELFILIEKDFVCLDNTFEDQSDNFPNPNAVC